MIMIIMRWLSDIARWISTRHREHEQRQVDRAQRERQTALVYSAKAHRLQRLAARERMEPSDLEDAIQMAAAEHELTAAQILDLVEQHGFGPALDRIQRASG